MIQKKICLLGSFAVGKTSLIRRYVEGIFTDRYLTTVGVKIDRRELSLDNLDLTLAIWDMSGEDVFSRLQPSYVRSASGYLLVIDGTRPESLEKAVELHQRVGKLLGGPPFLAALNKADLAASWRLDPANLQRLEGDGWSFRKTSALTGEGVESLFDDLARSVLEREREQAK